MFVGEFEENIPGIIKIVLKFYPKEHYYYPLFTFLIFNFLTSPKVQEIYQISPSFNKTVKELNLIIKVL